MAFWQTIPGVLAHLTLVLLLGLSLWFYLSGQNRMPLLIAGVFSGATVLSKLGASEEIPLFAVLPVAFLSTLLFYAARKEVTIHDLPKGALAALLLAQAFWFLVLWPFGEQTVGAVFASLFFLVSETVDSHEGSDLGTI